MSPSQEDSRHSIGVLGGAFDPPHLGHATLVLAALASGKYDEVWILPSGDHPHKPNITPFMHRLQMCRLAFRFMKDVKVSDFEQGFQGKTYTIDVVESLKEHFPRAVFTWLVGSDNRDTIQDWHRGEELLKLIPFDFYPRGLPNDGDDSSWSIPNISSSWIRAQLSADASTDDALCLDKAVLTYIRENGLYAK